MTKFRCTVAMMRVRLAFGLVLWMSLGCHSSAKTKPTREQCTQVSEHVADLILAESLKDPATLWDAIKAEPGDDGLPADLTKETFAPWLDSPAGKTWLVQRRGNVLAATRQAVDGCVQNGSEAVVSCLLAARSKADVDACDAKAH